MGVHDQINRLVSIFSLNSFAYACNNANQRTSATLADGSAWAFGYDSLGQVTSGKRAWADGLAVAGEQFEYGFDDIGNRTSAKAGGNGLGANLRTSNSLLASSFESRQAVLAWRKTLAKAAENFVLLLVAALHFRLRLEP